MKGFGILPAALVAGVAGLSGCGGDGGDDGPSYSGSTQKAAVTDRASANALASNAACALLHYCAGASSRAPAVAAERAWPRSELAGALKTTKTACPQGGSKTVTESDDELLDVGHTSTVDYDKCAEYDRSNGGVRQDGTNHLEITAVTGTPLESANWSITEQWQYDTLRIDALDGSGRSLGYTLFHGNGAMTQQPGDALEYMQDTRYTQLYTKGTFGTPDELLVRNGSLHEEWSSTSDHVISGREGEVCSTLIGGCVTLHTPANLNFPMGYGYAPDAGEVVITAANNARIRLTVVDFTRITIDYDINPVDGTYEDSETTTWDAL